VATQADLTAAETAYRNLMTGQAVKVLVDQNGERVEFKPADASKLAAYIYDLKSQLGMVLATRGPMNVWL
jgi:predicted regulator of Ras-like GTPase activity (Roadblock/LC7/MglB family)